MKGLETELYKENHENAYWPASPNAPKYSNKGKVQKEQKF